MTQNQATWQVASTAATQAEAAWRQVDVAALSQTLGRKLALLDRGLPLLRQGLSVLTLACSYWAWIARAPIWCWR